MIGKLILLALGAEVLGFFAYLAGFLAGERIQRESSYDEGYQDALEDAKSLSSDSLAPAAGAPRLIGPIHVAQGDLDGTEGALAQAWPPRVEP